MAGSGSRMPSAKTTPASSSDREILRLISELYYLRDLRQPEIAALTGFSVSKVSRILAQAREKGVVHISIEPASEGPSPAAERLSDRYGVAVMTTPGREADPAAAARLCGLAAAEHIAQLLPVEWRRRRGGRLHHGRRRLGASPPRHARPHGRPGGRRVGRPEPLPRRQ